MITIPKSNKTILENLQKKKIFIESPCNGYGTCGKCKVQILDGKTNSLTLDESKFLSEAEISNGVRLACRATPTTSLSISILNQSKIEIPYILNHGFIPTFSINPHIKAMPFSLNTNVLCRCKSISDSIKEFFPVIHHIPPLLLKRLPSILNSSEKKAVIYDNQLIDIIDMSKHIYGMAIDIGTTTVVCTLVNMESHEEIASLSFINPQISYGQDVLSRIHYSMEQPDGILNLQSAIISKINSSLQELCNKYNIEVERIYEIVISANTTMTHSLLGVPLETLGRFPYSSLFTEAVSIYALEAGLIINPLGKLYCIPSISTFIGGDITSGILVSRIFDSLENILFIDIGTNGELVLGNKDSLISCSCAVGPALEGMNISCGMRAVPGAIEKVSFENGSLKYETINNYEATGLCGSGLLEAINVLIKHKVIGSNGRLDISSPLVTEVNGKRRVNLTNKIYISQNDIRQVQLCKGAILSGIHTLLNYKGLSISSIDKILVSGQFGKHLSKESLTGIGIIPKELIDKILYIGNSSKEGALMCLLSKEERKKAEILSKGIQCIDLSTMEEYEQLFTKCLKFN